MLYCFRSPNVGVFDQVDELAVGWEVYAGQFDYPRGDGCREKQVLGLLLRSVLFNELEDLLDVLLEALLEHLVCLIKASYLQVGKLNGASLKQVYQPSRCRHDYIATIANLPNLFMDVASSVDCHNLKIPTHPQAVNLISHLNGQLNKIVFTSRVGTTIKNFNLPPSLKWFSFRKR